MENLKIKKEEFKDIKGYEGLYQIGTNGTVISLPRVKKNKGGSYITKKKTLVMQINKFGYNSVCLTDTYHTKKKIDIHRLVAVNFIPNPDEKEQVNHLDGNKSNNSVSNLEWSTRKENMAHAVELGLMARGEKHWKSSLTKDEVKVIKNLLKTKLFNNQQIAVLVNQSRQTISRIKHEKRWAHVK